MEFQEEKKKVVVFYLHTPKNVKLRSFTLESCSDGNEMCEKAVMHAIPDCTRTM